MYSIKRLSNGGFVVHGITSATKKGRVSAWYNSLGVLQDCEFIDSLNRVRSIPDNWNECYRRLASIGGAYSSMGRL